MSIAAGFVLRLLAGCAAIGVAPTSWIVVCGFSLVLVLGFGKRRVEMAREITRDHRPTLQSYSSAKLDTLLAISTAVCLLSHMICTIALETIQRHRKGNLLCTIPFVPTVFVATCSRLRKARAGMVRRAAYSM